MLNAFRHQRRLHLQSRASIPDGIECSTPFGIYMADGTQLESGPGDVTALPSGHDAWVIGDEPVVLIDWHGASNYARA